MDDARQFGRELADITLERMEAENLSGMDGAKFAVREIANRAREMIAQGGSREAVESWTGLVTIAYSARLDERIKATEESDEQAAGISAPA